MQAIDWLVVTGGVVTILWVNWYFFAAPSTAIAASVGRTGAQDVTITVQGGYTPSVINATAGTPLRIVFDRKETSGCSEEVTIPAFGIRAFLKANAKTTVEITPTTAGTYEFTCGMGMLRGRIVVA